MEIKVPAVGESVMEALVARWLKQEGDAVAKDEPICEIETDKITLEIQADAAGVLNIVVPEGETVRIGTVIGNINEGAPAMAAPKPAEKPAAQPAEPPPAQPTKAAPGRETARETPPLAAEPHEEPPTSPAGRKLARELGIAADGVAGSGRGGRVTAEDLRRHEAESRREPAPEAKATPGPAPAAPSGLEAAPRPAPEASPAEPGRITRKPMSPLRKKIAQRLVSVRQNTAMLTTFNEADLTEVMQLRKRHGEHFLQRHNVKLGLMSFFIRACCEALVEFPEVNASIEGNDIVYHNYCDIGVAVGSEKGLVVPVLRNAERLTLAQIEQAIVEFGTRIRENRLELADLEGGTFTVSNGGIYGSLLSTPILNPPQSGVLGMHSIQERPVAREGQVVIRPMMYLALSYDHRIVDGKGAVGFLKRVKEYIEDPQELLLEG
ncbi:2-oxoglutarate dehydrogenase complex dihydrolipoyllysine-residue succinyltransferase [Geomesophilobacter sediminis]|uniref:Dihydrolipoyllysine-residue succinyltransferase component of 2-oxoglutarate dehydrogenase complex n=1 Tax=Geomesophilobacter sediminis TaxID=2798584 RepID=A0A8J7M0T3_9BACT|nr:2-oxoglutarate dehydrogenase complex dihydrolipoyllysine-residue succinyltransferase [Geomesophilobacter sediminis]MBJ6726515.1 2-oxoglutarate dehydrogenase complex dihydrolipoyllysine-residue succinyltransferase [Geomesophilobacter sediminis]